jgi:hypothetical protein
LSGVFIWNHGYSHSGESHSQYTEFDNPMVEVQIGSIEQTQTLVHDLLGFRPSVFGPAFNRYSQQTRDALKAFPEIDTCFFAPEDFPEHFHVLGTLPRIVFEDKRFQFQPIVDTQVPQIATSERPTVMQIHPGKWDLRSHVVFERSMQVLLMQFRSQFQRVKSYE